MKRLGSANSSRFGSTSCSSAAAPVGATGRTTRPSGKPGCVTITCDVLLYTDVPRGTKPSVVTL
jgi:hypothetical protein